MKFGIIKERKTPPDRRVVFSPEKLKETQEKFPKASFFVETSDIRIFADERYIEAGFPVVEDLSHCDVLLGVKEVPISALIPNKSYFFFSHTIKKQPYNRDLLRAILEKNITLYDHETITNGWGKRLIGFGRYAGIVGAYNGFRALGFRDEIFDLPKVESLPDYDAVLKELDKIKIPNIKIVLTGSGKVAHGAKEILDHLKIKQVGVKTFLEKNFEEPVFCMLDVADYNKRKDGGKFIKKEFYKNPGPYESDFFRFAKVADFFIAGHFYGEGAPYFFTREEAKSPDFKINLIADVSCDINGPVPSTIRPSTIENPFYGYDPEMENETNFDALGAITVMAVDNLPCELPKDASDGFGEMFLNHVMPAFFNGDKNGILKRAKITENGKLTENFTYLQDYVEGVEN